MRNRILSAALTSIALAALAVTANAQSTISVTMAPLVTSYGFGPPGGAPFSASWTHDIDPPGYANHIEDVQPGSYFDLKVTCTTPGWYTIGMQWMDVTDDFTTIQFETRPFSSPEDLYATHYATMDSVNMGRAGTWGTSAVPRVYQLTDPVVATDGTTALQVPLWAGDNIIRVRNVSGRHEAAFAYPPDLSDKNNRPWGAFWSNFHILSLDLKRVGNLPAMGTITGTVTGDLPTGVPVTRAIVTANDPGKSSPELTSFWLNGWYTYTKADGAYTLQAPVGTQDVKAGRPSSYQVQGTLATGVAVPASGSVTTNLGLKSIFFQDPASNNDWTAYPQAEYLDTKIGNIGLLPVDGQNGYKLGWTGGGETVSLIIDVPAAGNYEVSSSYSNGGATGRVRVVSSLGPFTEDDQVNSGGWGTVITKVFANSIYLIAGTQTLTMGLVSGDSDYDGIKLRKLNTPVTVGVVQGTITDSTSGLPLAGATVTFAGATVTTDAFGKYKAVGNLGAAQAFTVTAPFMDNPYTSTVDVVTPAITTKDASIAIRPHITLSSANGNVAKAILNTGDAVDYSAVAADESAFAAYTFPGNWDIIATTDDIYGWIRIHFTLPAGFTTQIPGRAVRVRVFNGGVDDVSKMFVNGTLIGQTGSFPNPAVPIQLPAHRNPEVGSPAGTFTTYWPGMDIAPGTPITYYIPAGVLTPGDNVLAIKCFDWALAGGLFGTTVIEVAPPTGAVTGTVKAGGVGVASARVAVSDANGMSSAWSWTDAAGAFSLPYANAGPGVIGVTKLGYNAVATAVNVPTGGSTTADLITAAVAGGNAPVFDDFAGTDPNAWQAKWWAVSLADNSIAANVPLVQQPGYDVNAGPLSTIPGTVTVYQPSNGQRSSIISKSRFSKFASVNEAKIVSALHYPEDNSSQPNVILHLNGSAAADPSTATGGVLDPSVELDMEGYVLVGTETRPRWNIFATGRGQTSNGGVPFSLAQMNDLTPSNPLNMTISRTGSVYDFYLNNTLLHSENLPIMTTDHRIAVYSFHVLGQITIDSVSASPIAGAAAVKGDINANGVLDYSDVVNALRIAGGLSTSTTAQVTAGNQAGADSIISVLDAARIGQALNGKAL